MLQLYDPCYSFSYGCRCCSCGYSSCCKLVPAFVSVAQALTPVSSLSLDPFLPVSSVALCFYFPSLFRPSASLFVRAPLCSSGHSVCVSVFSGSFSLSLPGYSLDSTFSIPSRTSKFCLLLVLQTHLSYGKEFSRAIEEKQVAQQESERIKFVVAMTEQEKKAAVIKAEGEAEAASLISRAIKEHGGGLIEVRRLDAARDIADSLSKTKNVTYIPQGVNMLFSQQ